MSNIPGAELTPIAQEAPNDGGQGLRFNMQRALAIFGVSALAFVGAETMLTGTDQAQGDQTIGQTGVPYCNYPNDYNTILCSRTKLQAEQYCARAVTIQPPENFRGRLVDARSGKYKLSYSEPVLGCGPAGIQDEADFTELRQGPQGSFTRNSNIVSFRTNKAFTAHKTLEAPVDCSAPGMAGSAIRPVVKVTWLTAKGWPKLPKSETTQTFDGKAQSVC